MYKRMILCGVLSLLFMAGVFRPGCRVIVNGSPMPGIYAAEAVTRCTEEAEQSHTDEDAPFTVVPVLCIRREALDEDRLTEALEAAYR